MLDSNAMPTRQFLTGALWVSRNLGVIIEDLGESITAAQQQSKQTVSEAMQETADPEQLYRLVLLQFNRCVVCPDRDQNLSFPFLKTG